MIDIHPHVIAEDTRRYPHAPLGGKQSDWSRSRPVSFERMLTAMDEAGIARPDRFAGVFSVDMLAPDASERIRHWMSRGLTGLRVFIAGHTTAQETRLDDPRSFSAWQCAVDAGLAVCVQLRAAGLPQLETLLQRFPQARVILDHMARPVVDDAGSLFALARYRNLFLKLTIHNVRDAGQAARGFLARVVEAFGASRIAWGSNYPASEGSLRSLLTEARSALDGVSDADREWIFSRTAQSLYPATRA